MDGWIDRKTDNEDGWMYICTVCDSRRISFLTLSRLWGGEFRDKRDGEYVRYVA